MCLNPSRLQTATNQISPISLFLRFRFLVCSIDRSIVAVRTVSKVRHFCSWCFGVVPPFTKVACKWNHSATCSYQTSWTASPGGVNQQKRKQQAIEAQAAGLIRLLYCIVTKASQKVWAVGGVSGSVWRRYLAPCSTDNAMGIRAIRNNRLSSIWRITQWRCECIGLRVCVLVRIWTYYSRFE